MGCRTHLVDELRGLIAAHARPDLRTPVNGLLLSKVGRHRPYETSLTEPLLVLMAQGGKQLLLGDRLFEYRSGQYLVVTTDLPVTGHFIEAGPETPSLGIGLVLRPAVIAPLLLEAPSRQHTTSDTGKPALATGEAGPELLDAFARMLRLLDHPPADVPVLAPMIEREILWRMLTGPHGGMIPPDRPGRQRSHPRQPGHPLDPWQLRRTDADRGPRSPGRHERFRVPPALPCRHDHEPAAVPETHSPAGSPIATGRPARTMSRASAISSGSTARPSSAASTAGCSAPRPVTTPHTYAQRCQRPRRCRARRPSLSLLRDG